MIGWPLAPPPLSFPKVAGVAASKLKGRNLRLRPCGVLRLQAPPTNTFHLSRTAAGNAAVGTVVRHPVCTHWRLVGVATVDPSKMLSQLNKSPVRPLK